MWNKKIDNMVVSITVLQPNGGNRLTKGQILAEGKKSQQYIIYRKEQQLSQRIAALMCNKQTSKQRN